MAGADVDGRGVFANGHQGFMLSIFHPRRRGRRSNISFIVRFNNWTRLSHKRPTAVAFFSHALQIWKTFPSNVTYLRHHPPSGKPVAMPSAVRRAGRTGILIRT